jgi:hypothetical protein
MIKSRRLRSLRYRFLAIVALALTMIMLLGATANPQSDCCNKCLARFQQCDGNTIVCCQIYDACVQQCRDRCPSCPDQ